MKLKNLTIAGCLTVCLMGQSLFAQDAKKSTTRKTDAKASTENPITVNGVLHSLNLQVSEGSWLAKPGGVDAQQINRSKYEAHFKEVLQKYGLKGEKLEQAMKQITKLLGGSQIRVEGKAVILGPGGKRLEIDLSKATAKGDATKSVIAQLTFPGEEHELSVASVGSGGKFMVGLNCVAASDVLRSQLKTGDAGLVVVDVLEGTAAKKAGLKKMDVLIAAGDASLKSTKDLVASVQKAGEAKQTLALSIIREGKKRVINVTPVERKGVMVAGNYSLLFKKRIVVEPKTWTGSIPLYIPRSGGVVKGGAVGQVHIYRKSGSGDRIDAMEKQIDKLQRQINELQAQFKKSQQTAKPKSQQTAKPKSQPTAKPKSKKPR
jgi:hypothetical protein